MIQDKPKIFLWVCPSFLRTVLKEQLELVKRSLVAHQEKSATTELSMMDAILLMKEQI